MSSTPRASALVPVALVAALAAAGVGVYVFLREAPPVPAPVVPAPAPAPVPAPTPAPAPAVEPAGQEAVTGRVLHGAEGEEAVAGAIVEVYAADGGPVPFLAPLARGESGADGRFRVGGLGKDVAYRVRAAKEGMSTTCGEATGAGDPVDIRLLPASFAAGTVKDAETKSPVPGARVVCGDAVGMETGPDGAFRLERIPAGPVVLTATAPGYAELDRHLPETKRGRTGLTLLLTPASTVSGIVLAPDGAPAAGASVTLREFRDIAIAGSVQTGSKEATSGPDGRFRIEGVPFGLRIKVDARSETGISDTVEAGPFQKGEPAADLVLKLSPAAILVVTVLDEAGRPVEGASVSHAPEAAKEEGEGGEDGDGEDGPAAPFFGPGRQAGGTSATTDASGVARLRPVPPGPTVVSADKQDFIAARETAAAAASAETPVTLRLATGLSIAGKVVDEAGRPVPAAAVSVSRYRGKEGFVHETRQSGEDGSFRVGGLEGKGFDVNGNKQGFVNASLSKVDPAAGPVTLALSRAGSVKGIVVDEEGKPAPSFTVSAKRTDAPKGRGRGMDFAFGGGGSEVKDPEGKFLLENLVPGVYTITAKAPESGPGHAADVKVEAGATAETKVVLVPGLVLQGIVVRRADESPVAGATVSVAQAGPFGEMDMDFDMEGLEGFGGGSGEGSEGEDLGNDDGGAAKSRRDAIMEAMGGGGPGTATTDADGRFVLKGLEAGSVTLKVKAKEFAPATKRGVAVPAEGDVKLLLADAAAIEGTVYDALRNPRTGVMVMLQRPPMSMKMGTTDAKGHYHIKGLAPGKYLFFVMGDKDNPFGGGGGLNLKSETVVLEEGKTLVKDHRMGEGTRLTGKVTRGGKPAGSVMVMLLPGAGRKDAAAALTGGSGFAMASTKEDGSYEITGLAPGVYTAMVQVGMGGVPAPGDPVEIPAGAKEVKRDIVLARNSVRGIVVDSAGEPVEGAKVHAVATGRDVSRSADLGEALSSMGGQAETGDDGRFALEDMNAGSFTIQASADGKGTAILEDVVPGEGGTEVRLTLVKGVEVTVKVVDADGKPVAGAGVYLSDPRGINLSDMEMFDTDRTGADGKAVVSAPPGAVLFEAVVRGHAPGSTTATAEAGAEVVITLPRGSTLEVLVTDAGGGPLAGAGVQILDAAGKPYAPRITAEGIGDLLSSPATGGDGKYVRADLPAGTWTVRASSGERTAEASASLAAGERKTVTVRIP